MARIAGLLVLSLLLLFACSDLSLLSPQAATTATVEVRSLTQGGVVQPDQPITFMVRGDKDSKAPLLLEITVTNSSGQGVWSSSQESPLTDEELVLRLPALETGEYRLAFNLSRASSPAVSKEISFFYVQKPFGIAGVSSYPPTIQPENRILLRAELAYPQGADPFLRWTQDGRVLGKGRASEGFGQISWQAPKQEGVYAVRVELFPAAPTGASDYPFASSLALTAQLYVTSATAASADELAPKDSYFSLFHFAGSLRDEVAGVDAEAFGTAAPLSDGQRGYRLAPGSGIRYGRLILPVNGGALSPCTLTLRLNLDENNAGRDLLTVQGPNRAFRLALFLDGEGLPQASLDLPASPGLRLPSGIKSLSPGQPHRLDLSLIPSARALTALWFLDGEQSSTTILKVEPIGLPAEGQTLIGGEGGVSGRITELGVYYQDERKRPTVDPGIYRFMMEKKYGRRLALAEGFEGSYLPEGFTVVPAAAARLDDGRLALEPDASLTLPFFDLNGPPTEETVLEIVLGAPLPPGATAVLGWEGDGKAFLEIRGDGKALTPGSSREQASFPPLTDSFKLAIGAERLALQTASEPLILALPRPASRERWLKLGLRCPASEKGLLIERILVYKNSGS
jgi:hypothetical protein